MRVSILSAAVFLGHQRAHFPNALASVERFGIWQLGLVGGFNPFEFYGRAGFGWRNRRIDKAAAAAAASSLRFVGIGHCVVWLHAAFCSSAARRLDASSFQAMWPHEAALNSLRFLTSFLILLVPTTAMGLTMPVLVGDPVISSKDFARVIGLLYGWNTLGAVVGVIVGEAYLIEAFGLLGTALIAGSVNCVAASLAFLLSRKATATATPHKEVQAGIVINTRLPWRLLLVSFGVGGIFLCLEVVWFRFLRLYIASSSTAFSIMLVAVLTGIGSGGIVAGVIRRRGCNNFVTPIVLVVAALVTLLSCIFFPAPPIQEKIGSSYIESWRQIGLLSFVLMFPVAFLSGIIFPIIVAHVQASMVNRMNSTGLTTLFNTTGAAAGPLVASFILLPSIGFQSSLILCAAGYGLLGMLAVDRSAWSLRTPRGWCCLDFVAV